MILVTGGAGFIGSHTIVELLDNNYDVVVVDDFSNSNQTVLNEVEGITGKTLTHYNIDLTKLEDLQYVFNQHQFEAVIHFAGYKSVNESVGNPISYYENNVLSTLNLVKLMKEYSVFNLIFSSSATVYGVPDKLPLTEEESTSVLNPYGRTKLHIEEMLSDVVESDHRWKVTSLRYFNPVGAHESGKIGENPNQRPNNLMPYITKVAANELEQVNVFGNDYPTKDGTGIRDYIHVVDLAKGHVAAMEKQYKLAGFEPINLGTGVGYSVLEVIKTYEKVNGVKVPYNITDRRPGDVAISYADASKAHKLLNWGAKYKLEKMCYDAWKYKQQHQKDGLVGDLK